MSFGVGLGVRCNCREGVDLDLSEYLKENEPNSARQPNRSHLSDYPRVLYFEKVPTQAEPLQSSIGSLWCFKLQTSANRGNSDLAM
jgi:hypothetical protein